MEPTMGNNQIANSPTLAKIRKFGGVMSGMVMPNLGAFVGWGLMAAIFIPNGWFPNEKLGEMVGPILNIFSHYSLVIRQAITFMANVEVLSPHLQLWASSSVQILR